MTSSEFLSEGGVPIGATLWSELQMPEMQPEQRDQPSRDGRHSDGPPTEEPVDSAQINLGRAHFTLASGVGSGVAYIGLALGLGTLGAGVAGLATFIGAKLYMVNREFPNATSENVEDTLPKSYVLGAYNVAPWLAVGSLIGFRDPGSAGPTVLMLQLGLGVIFSKLAQRGKD